MTDFDPIPGGDIPPLRAWRFETVHQRAICALAAVSPVLSKVIRLQANELPMEDLVRLRAEINAILDQDRRFQR